MEKDYLNTTIGKNMENKFAVHYQTWKNEKATEFTIKNIKNVKIFKTGRRQFKNEKIGSR